MTFLRYITQRSGFGRTSWTQFAIITTFILLWIGLSVDSYPEHLWWVPGGVAVLMSAIVIGGTVSNYRADSKRWAAPPNRNHYQDVCEGCDPVRMADGTVILSLTKWYAAVNGQTREQASEALRNVSVYRESVEAHNAYMKAFPKPVKR